MINRLIEKDEIPGDWYTPRKVAVVPDTPPPPPPQVKRDEQGWGVEDEGPLDKLGTAPGETPPADEEGFGPDASSTAPATRKPVFGRPRRRYSERL
jgi:hypothetical protein